MVLGCSQVGVAGPAAVGNSLWLVIAPSPPATEVPGEAKKDNTTATVTVPVYIRHALSLSSGEGGHLISSVSSRHDIPASIPRARWGPSLSTTERCLSVSGCPGDTGCDDGGSEPDSRGRRRGSPAPRGEDTAGGAWVSKKNARCRAEATFLLGGAKGMMKPDNDRRGRRRSQGLSLCQKDRPAARAFVDCVVQHTTGRTLRHTAHSSAPGTVTVEAATTCRSEPTVRACGCGCGVGIQS